MSSPILPLSLPPGGSLYVTRRMESLAQALRTAGSGVSLLTGVAGVGKTIAAQWLTAQLNQETGARACYFPCLSPPPQQKTNPTYFLRTLYGQFLRPLSLRERQSATLPDLTALFLTEWFQTGRQWLFLDNADVLSKEYLAFLQSLMEGAQEIPFSLCLIGGAALLLNLQYVPALRDGLSYSSVWQPFSLPELLTLIPAQYPTFAALARDQPNQRQLIAYIHQVTGGVWRRLHFFLRDIEQDLQQSHRTLSLDYLKARQRYRQAQGLS